MVRLVSTLAIVAFAASAGTAAAECFGGHKDVTASVSQPQEGAAISTYDGKLPLSEQPADEAKAADAPAAEPTEAEQDKK